MLHANKSYLVKLGLKVLVLWLLVMGLLIAHNNYQFHNYLELKKTAVIKPVKVFQIGFNKCGTSTLANFFERNGVPAIHHDYGNLASSIDENYKNGRPLLSDKYSKILVFTDMELVYREPQVNVGTQYFKELDKQYPGSKFILNVRNKKQWLKSRASQPVEPSQDSFLTVSAKIQKITEEEMLQKWSVEWDTHIAQVVDYFKDRPDDLLVFDIDHDGPQKIVDFFKDNFRLNTKWYSHKNKTAFKTIRNKIYKYIWQISPQEISYSSQPLSSYK